MRIQLNLIQQLTTERDILIKKIEWHKERDYDTSAAYLTGRLDIINEILGDR